MSASPFRSALPSRSALLSSYPFEEWAPAVTFVESSDVAFGPPSGTDPDRFRPSAWVSSKTRRLLDLAFAVFALVLLSPLLAMCWLLVRCTSPGPALFRQVRTGRDGVGFTLYKFRSMRVQAPGEHAGHTVVGDLRITPVGAFLRRFKLDELPQFWNVLKGDMSLVGPRPKLAHHEALTMPYRPGLTGRATLAFRHEESMLREIDPHEVDRFYQILVKPLKAQLDRDYMRSATFISDLGLIYRTFFRCIDCTGDPRQEMLDLVYRYAPECAVLFRSDRRPHVIVEWHPLDNARRREGVFESDLNDAA